MRGRVLAAPNSCALVHNFTLEKLCNYFTVEKWCWFWAHFGTIFHPAVLKILTLCRILSVENDTIFKRKSGG
jgi:hypothetical protein